MISAKELAYKYMKKRKPTVFDSGIGARLPDAYRKFYDEWRNTPAKPVNYIPYTGKIWVRDEVTGEVKRHENIPIPGRFPPQFENVFTGGEMIIQGFTKKTEKKKKFTTRVPRFWIPVVFRSVLYSEILDKYLAADMTKRVIELIHEHQGFDNYLLQTKACDLKTLVALKVKQRLLLALSNKDLPYDKTKNNQIYQKYEKYLIPPEEIEWYGLNFTEACIKLKKIEEANAIAAITPLKHIYRAKLIKNLEKQNLQLQESENTEKKSLHWLAQKVPGLRKFTNKEE